MTVDVPKRTLTILLVALLAACAGPAPQPADDTAEVQQADTADPRQDLFTIAATDTVGQIAAQGQLFSIPAFDVTHNADGTYTIPTAPFSTLSGKPLCCSTDFYGEPAAAAGATGVLVGPDLVLTASHTMGTTLQEAQAACAPAGCTQVSCAGRLFIADYALTSSTQSYDSATTRPGAAVYGCKQVTYFDHTADVVVIQLDRPVAGRVPLKPRRSGALPTSPTGAVFVGYPHRLPAKIERGSIAAASSGFFNSALPASPGNSGAAVVNLLTGRIEGIVQSGGTGSMDLQGQTCPADVGTCTVECFDPAANCYNGSSGHTSDGFAGAIPPVGLEVTTGPDVTSQGCSGGPFTNATVSYTLAAGAAGLGTDLSISVSGPVRVTSSVSHLAPGAVATVTVAVDASRTVGLRAGLYGAQVSFTDRTYGTVDTFQHAIQVTSTCNQPCGANACGSGTYCCNSSCGTCAPLGGQCTQQYCPPTE